jgi:hypothetical protein
MFKNGITIRNQKGNYIIDDIDTIDRFVIIRKIMTDRKGEIYYGRKRVIGLDQLNEYQVV